MENKNNELKISSDIIFKLNKNSLDKSDFIGIICSILYSKDIFPKNKDIVPFLKEVFSVSYLEYVINSRTLIVARISKNIYKSKNEDISFLKKKVIEYFSINEDNENIEKPGKSSKKKNANEKLESWLKGL